MTTLNKIASFSSLRNSSPADFVSTDSAALASHMDHCASARSRFFGLHAALESAHSVISPRMVTAAVIAMVVLGLFAIV